ncbi:MAG: response regulator, partial [Candidatus Thermoplasmatota archaeon]|nr:response regulator [Candidatus Thermoplasmatota archaeon]
DEALEAFREAQPDIVFLDVNMPGMQGEKVAEAILSENPMARIIGVTGLHGAHDQVIDMVSAGVFEVIQKPVRKAKIDAVLEELKREKGNFGRIQ